MILGLRVVGSGELGVGSDMEVIEGVGVKICLGDVIRAPLLKSQIVPSVIDFLGTTSAAAWQQFETWPRVLSRFSLARREEIRHGSRSRQCYLKSK